MPISKKSHSDISLGFWKILGDKKTNKEVRRIMQTTINLTDNNHSVMLREYRNYKLMEDPSITFDAFKELVFLNGLLSLKNGIDVRSMRTGRAFSSIIDGEIIEYR